MRTLQYDPNNLILIFIIPYRFNYYYFSSYKDLNIQKKSNRVDFEKHHKLNQMYKPAINFSPFVKFNSIINFKLSGALWPYWDGRYIKLKNMQHPSHEGNWIKVTAPRLNDETVKANHDQEVSQYIKNKREIFYVLTSQVFDILYVGVTSKGFEEGLLGQNGRFHHHIKKFLAIKGSSTNHTKGWHDHAYERYQFAIEQHLDTSVFLDDLMISLGGFEENLDLRAEDFEGFVLSSAFAALQGIKGTQVLNTGALKYRPAEINLRHWFD